MLSANIFSSTMAFVLFSTLSPVNAVTLTSIRDEARNGAVQLPVGGNANTYDPQLYFATAADRSSSSAAAAPAENFPGFAIADVDTHPVGVVPDTPGFPILSPEFGCGEDGAVHGEASSFKSVFSYGDIACGHETKVPLYGNVNDGDGMMMNTRFDRRTPIRYEARVPLDNFADGDALVIPAINRVVSGTMQDGVAKPIRRRFSELDYARVEGAEEETKPTDTAEVGSDQVSTDDNTSSSDERVLPPPATGFSWAGRNKVAAQQPKPLLRSKTQTILTPSTSDDIISAAEGFLVSARADIEAAKRVEPRAQPPTSSAPPNRPPRSNIRSITPRRA
jgi:hypothetical protein